MFLFLILFSIFQIINLFNLSFFFSLGFEDRDEDEDDKLKMLIFFLFF